MADFKSGLPVRTEADGADERLQSKIVDMTTPAQGMTVDTDGNAHAEMHGNDSAGVDRVVLTDTEGRLIVVSEESADGVDVNDYKTSAAVAKDASVTHDYTVTALKTLSLKKIYATSSGRLKVELIEDPLVTPVTHYVGFSSSSNPNIDFATVQDLNFAAGTLLRLTITNRDNNAMDVYSNLIGQEDLA